MRTQIAAIVAFLLMIGSTIRGMDGASEHPSIADLIGQLGSSEFAGREAAMRKLEALGARALPVLRSSLSDLDPEVTHRVQQLIRDIEQRLDSERLLAPRKFRLSISDAPLSIALAEFNKQTGANLQVPPDALAKFSRRISMDAKDVTFWEALALFCRQSGLVEQELLADPSLRSGDAESLTFEAPAGFRAKILTRRLEVANLVEGHDGKFVLVPASIPSVPTYLAGALRVRALPTATLGAGAIPGEKDRYLQLEVTPPPGLGWLGLLGLRIDRATDERGNEWKAPRPFVGDPLAPQLAAVANMVFEVRSGDLDFNQLDQNRWAVPMLIRADREPGRYLKELHGTLSACVRTSDEALLAIPDLPNAVGTTIQGDHGGSLRLVDYERGTNGNLGLKVVLVKPPESQQESPLSSRQQLVVVWNSVDNRAPSPPNLSLVDDQGREYELVAHRASKSAEPGSETFHLIYRPRPGQGAPSRLIFKGSRTAIVETSFILRNVAIP